MADGQEQGSPLKAILRVRRRELPFALLMAAYFFLVITTFWILKPIKKPLFVSFYDRVGFDVLGTELSGAQTELIAKVANMVVAAGAVVVFSALARTLRRQQLTFVFCGFFAVLFGLFSLFIVEPSAWFVWTIYLGGDLWTTLMVATFFAFLNDSVRGETARRIYGLIVLGGVTGGAFGSSNVRAWIDLVSQPQWMWICAGLTLAIVVVAWAAGRRIPAEERAQQQAEEAEEAEHGQPAADDNPALAGARLVARSRYLLAIVAIVGIYEIVSTVLDYQFTETVQHYATSEQEAGKHYATVYAITNWTSMLFQLLLTSAIMSNFRLVVSLLVTPAAIFLSSATFLVSPTLWPGSLLSTSDNALNYSINQSAREALYTPTTRHVKYKAKAFIDMFVMRFAKALAVGLSLGITVAFAGLSTVRWLSLLSIGLLLVWFLAARYAGVRFHDLLEGGAPPPGTEGRERRGETP